MSDTLTARLDALFDPFDRTDRPGLVVGVARGDDLLYRRALGMASLEQEVANSPATRMRIGSTTKHFACLAALLLVEDGRLDIDTPLRRHLPEMPEPPAGQREPTLRELMTHTGGLRCHLDLQLIASGTARRPVGDALETLKRLRTTNFAPGAKMIYANSGHHLLSVVIERVAGLPFERFLEERLFRPLGMLDTAAIPGDHEIHRGMATLHLPTPAGTWRRGLFPSEDVKGEGSIVSTVGDMLRWLRHFRAPVKRVGGDASWRQLVAPAVLDSGLRVDYALGLMRHKYRGVDVIHHAGNVVGGASQMLTVPEHGLDVVILTNGAMVNPIALGFQVVDAVLGVEPGTSGNSDMPGVLGAPDGRPLAAEFAPMLGVTYLCRETGFTLALGESVEGRLGLSVAGGPPVPVRQADGRIVLGIQDFALGPIEIDPDALARGHASPPDALDVRESGHRLRLTRVGGSGANGANAVKGPAGASLPPSDADIAATFGGTFLCDELGVTASVRATGEGVEIELSGRHGTQRLTASPLSGELLRWAGTDPSLPLMGTLFASEVGRQGRALRLLMNTSRTRALSFERAIA